MSPQPAEHRRAACRSRHASRTARARRRRWCSTWPARPADAVVAANKSMRTLAVETVRTLPRLARLGQINDHTRISLGRIMSEQARRRARRRVPAVRRAGAHLRGGRPPHRQRRARPDRGRCAPGRSRRRADGDPTQRAGGDRGAVAARRGRGADAARRRPRRRGAARREYRDHHRPERTSRPPAGCRCRCWCSAAVRPATCTCCPTTPTSSTWRRSTPTQVELPGWYRPNPGLARDLAFVAFSPVGGELVARQITNYRWAVSAFGTASAAALGRRDTVYCLTPLHHQSGLLVSLGGAVVGGSRIALSRGLQPDRFVQEMRQYGVTVVTYTWAMLREVIDDPAFDADGQPPGAAVHRFGHADRAVAARHRRVRARARRRVLRHHRRAGRAGQRGRRQDRQQGPAAARRRQTSNSPPTTPTET